MKYVQDNGLDQMQALEDASQMLRTESEAIQLSVSRLREAPETTYALIDLMIKDRLGLFIYVT